MQSTGFTRNLFACAFASMALVSYAGAEQTQTTAVSTVSSSAVASTQVTPAAVVKHYADIAYANYSDGLTTAKALQKAVETFLQAPTEANLAKAKEAWIAARVPYQQTEVFRFGNAIVDDWEGQVNAWPLDEGLIDYVDASYEHELGNEGAKANIIANATLKIGNNSLDVSKLTPKLLADLNELGGSEANVASGYHAIEFLLWGQDLNGTNPGAGKRPATDYTAGKACTNGNCERRAAYLKAAAELLVNDLDEMVKQWSPTVANNYRQQLLNEKPEDGLRKMLFGMGSLALGELAGERIKVALEANSPEDEHDCFSDNTHYSHYYNGKGVKNIYFGEYKRVDGSVLSGPSLADLVKQKDANKAKAIASAFNNTEQALQAMVDSAKNGFAFDQLIAANNKKANQIPQNAIQALVAETAAIEMAAGLIGVSNLSPDTADHEFN
ncbi:imelysin family protein [Spartinivicinus poritis]|uniref:Peptidase n=1 Tax=Spartinivicinus poritis TaxID=2994640 RepID=A0ABT5U8Z1_9GAMM|nr:imelysin family protein [Spartinivicinus sp. A2-2]MDE1462846.1 peptidase [Spartinivicinus sp. A2-2]